MEGAAEERDGKLYFKGTTKTQAEANKIRDAIKTVPDWGKEIVAAIKATDGDGEAAAGGRTYTVKPGDTLSKIAKQSLVTPVSTRQSSRPIAINWITRTSSSRDRCSSFREQRPGAMANAFVLLIMRIPATRPKPRRCLPRSSDRVSGDTSDIE